MVQSTGGLAEHAAAGRGAEITLLNRLRAQDASALEALMERYGPQLYRVAMGITRNTSP